jgi:hypothetical protein
VYTSTASEESREAERAIGRNIIDPSTVWSRRGQTHAPADTHITVSQVMLLLRYSSAFHTRADRWPRKSAFPRLSSQPDRRRRNWLNFLRTISFGKVLGWVIVLWILCFGTCISSLMNNSVL